MDFKLLLLLLLVVSVATTIADNIKQSSSLRGEISNKLCWQAANLGEQCTQIMWSICACKNDQKGQWCGSNDVNNPDSGTLTCQYQFNQGAVCTRNYQCKSHVCSNGYCSGPDCSFIIGLNGACTRDCDCWDWPNDRCEEDWPGSPSTCQRSDNGP
jgi:hypothetical protein